MAWTKERVELLKKLWAEGLSCSVIADRMGGHLTRNAVIGKVSRLGLPGRDTTRKFRQVQSGRAAAQRQRQAKKKAAAAKSPTPLQAVFNVEPFVSRPVFEVPESQRKVLDDLDSGDCRFPYGDGPFTFCARPKVAGLSYCREHAQVCYQPPKAPTRSSGNPANPLRLVADNDSGSGTGQGGQNSEIATSGAAKAKETV